MVHFGRAAQYRFDAPDGSYGVMYAALDFATCFAEALLRDSLLGDPKPTLFENDLAQLVVATLGPVRRRLRLARLLGPMPNLGIDGQISTHHDYRVTQAWSKALHDHPASVDGLLFASRMNSPALSVASVKGAARAKPCADPIAPRVQGDRLDPRPDRRS